MTTDNPQPEATQPASNTPATQQTEVVTPAVVTLPVVSSGDLIQLNEGIDTTPTLPNLSTGEE